MLNSNLYKFNKMSSKKEAIVHYNKNYYEWQEDQNIFGARANKFMFNKFIRENAKILDFGCSGGSFLNEFKNIKRFGVEVNKFAREIAIKNNIECFESSALLPKNYFDQIISHHALEHTENPLDELKNLYNSLVPGGSICIVVPLETKSAAYKEKDINYLK